MKIAILQSPDDASTARLSYLARAATDAAAAGVQVLVTPELFLSGYDRSVDHLHRIAQTADGPWAHAVARIAREHRMAILYGYPEHDGARCYNSAALIDANGAILARHRKTQLYGDYEHAVFAPGESKAKVFRLGRYMVGILICFEVEFPEQVRLLALDGADVILIPTALSSSARFVAEHTIRVRAHENGLFLAYANYCGEAEEITYAGASAIVAPDGSVLERAGEHETLLITTLDRTRLDYRRQHDNPLTERRPELYGGLDERPLASPREAQR